MRPDPELLEDLNTARHRMELGEPLSTTAAEMGLTPGELTELLNDPAYNVVRPSGKRCAYSPRATGGGPKTSDRGRRTID